MFTWRLYAQVPLTERWLNNCLLTRLYFFRPDFVFLNLQCTLGRIAGESREHLCAAWLAHSPCCPVLIMCSYCGQMLWKYLHVTWYSYTWSQESGSCLCACLHNYCIAIIKGQVFELVFRISVTQRLVQLRMTRVTLEVFNSSCLETNLSELHCCFACCVTEFAWEVVKRNVHGVAFVISLWLMKNWARLLPVLEAAEATCCFKY